MVTSWITDQSTLAEAAARIRERREAERARFEWQVATHLLNGGAIIVRGSTRRFFALSQPFCKELGATQCAALIAAAYIDHGASLDYEAAL